MPDPDSDAFAVPRDVVESMMGGAEVGADGGADDDDDDEDATTPPTRDPSRVGGVSANERSVSPNTAASKKWTAGRDESQLAGSFRAKLALRRTANETRA